MRTDHASAQGQRSLGAAAFVVFSALLCLTLAQLLLAPDGVRKTRQLEQAVADTQAEIATLERRNAALAAEVNNLKHGLEAAEERARADLGMIGTTESFYQIIDSPDGAAAPAP